MHKNDVALVDLEHIFHDGKSRPAKTALHQAVMDRRLKQLVLLVSKVKVNISARDDCGRTPLALACMLDDEKEAIKFVHALTQLGAKVDFKDYWRRSPMAYACISGRDLLLKQLLRQPEALLEVDQMDVDGNTPLHHAVICGNLNMVRLILKVYRRRRIDVDIKNNLGYTPLLLAMKFKHYDIADVLLNEANSSQTIKDDEFFRDANEWACLDDVSDVKTELKNHILQLKQTFAKKSERNLRSSFIGERSKTIASLPPIRSANLHQGDSHVPVIPTILNSEGSRDHLLSQLSRSNTFTEQPRTERMRRLLISTAKLRNPRSQTTNSNAKTLSDNDETTFIDAPEKHYPTVRDLLRQMYEQLSEQASPSFRQTSKPIVQAPERFLSPQKSPVSLRSAKPSVSAAFHAAVAISNTSTSRHKASPAGKTTHRN